MAQFGKYIPEWNLNAGELHSDRFLTEYKDHGKIRPFTYNYKPYYPIGFDFETMGTIQDATQEMLNEVAVVEGNASIYSWIYNMSNVPCKDPEERIKKVPLGWICKPHETVIAGGYFVSVMQQFCNSSEEVSPIFAKDLDIFTTNPKLFEMLSQYYTVTKEREDEDGEFTVTTVVPRGTSKNGFPVQIIYYPHCDDIMEVIDSFDINIAKVWVAGPKYPISARFPHLVYGAMLSVSDVNSVRNDVEATFNRVYNYIVNKGVMPDSLILNWMLERGYTIEDIINMMSLFDAKYSTYQRILNRKPTRSETVTFDTRRLLNGVSRNSTHYLDTAY